MAGPHGRAQGRRSGSTARPGVGRGPAHPGHRAAGDGDRLPRAARPGGRRVVPSPRRRTMVRATARRSPRGRGWSSTAGPSFFFRRGTLSCGWTRFARSGSASCSPASSGCARCWPPKGCSTRPASARAAPAGCVGLVTGRASAAEHDVVSVATRAGPRCASASVNTPTQGPQAVPEILDALSRSTATPRSTSSSSPAAAAASRTCCRSPTRRSAAASRLPDARRHRDRPRARHPARRPRRRPPRGDPHRRGEVDRARRRRGDRAPRQLRTRARRALHAWVEREEAALARLRPRRRSPTRSGRWRCGRTPSRAARAGRRVVDAGLRGREADVRHLRASLTALGPAATLARGYAIVQHGTGRRRPGPAVGGRARRATSCACASPTAPCTRSCAPTPGDRGGTERVALRTLDAGTPRR